MLDKACVTCGVMKPLGDYYRDKARPDGLYSRCKPCHVAATSAWSKRNHVKCAANARAWRLRNIDKAKEVSRRSAAKSYAENPAKWKARSKQYRAEHPEWAREYDRQRRIANRDMMAAYCRAYYEARKEVLKARASAYGKANREKLRPTASARARKRTALTLNAIPLWANSKAIRSLYIEAARLTAETGVPHEVDHIVPLQSKLVCGLHCEANLRVVPFAENRSKGNRTWPDRP